MNFGLNHSAQFRFKPVRNRTLPSLHDIIHSCETRGKNDAYTRTQSRHMRRTHSHMRPHARHGHEPRGGCVIGDLTDCGQRSWALCVVTCSVDTYSNIMIKICKPEWVRSLFDVMKEGHYTGSQSYLNLNMPAVMGQRLLYHKPANCSPKSRSCSPETKPLLFSRFPSESRHLPELLVV